MRVVSFAFLTPFFFLKGGLNVSTNALWASLGTLGILFAAKMVPKLVGVYPLARRFTAPHAAFTTLLMSTGLTFGTISSLFGLSHHQSGAIFRSCRGRHRQCGDPDADRKCVLPAAPSAARFRSR